MASGAHGSVAESAAAHLARSGATIKSIGDPSREIDRQAALLIEWASANGKILPAQDLGPLKAQGAEHEVYFRESDDRAVKRTYPGTFGVTPDVKGAQQSATPLFYLRRLTLLNEVFGSDMRLEGVTHGKPMIIGQSGEQPSLVVSQPWARALDVNNPHPTFPEVAEFMTRIGFEPLPKSYFGWTRLSDGVLILDARTDNFIKTKEGVVPIDLVVDRKGDE